MTDKLGGSVETKHTPGPWKAHATGLARSGVPEFEIHWSEDGECVAEIVHGEADARLIAAAPELLEALKYAVDIHTAGRIDGSIDHHINMFLKAANAAIAKATGSTK